MPQQRGKISNDQSELPTPQITTLGSSFEEAEEAIRRRALHQGVPPEEVEAFLEEIKKAKLAENDKLG